MADAKKPGNSKDGDTKKNDAAMKSLGKGIGDLQKDLDAVLKLTSKASGDAKAADQVGKLLDGIVKSALELKKEAASASK